MDLKLYCIIFYIFFKTNPIVANSEIFEQYDPNVVDEKDILWHQLFSKINALLKDISNQSESIEKLKIRQREHDQKLAEFMEKTQTQFMDLTNVLEGYKNHIEDLKKGFVIYAGLISIVGIKPSQRKIQQDYKASTIEFLNGVKPQFEKIEKGQAEYGKNLKYLTNQYMSNNNEWITILKREDGSVDFHRNWTEYKMGFGNPNGEFFIGLEKLHKLTTDGAAKELMIILRDYENEQRIAKYDQFVIGNESEKYILKKLGKYSGDAGDSLRTHKGIKFSTYDQDNDQLDGNCSREFKGGWWYTNCYKGNLSGQYNWRLHWFEWKSSLLKYAEMKIRARL